MISWKCLMENVELQSVAMAELPSFPSRLLCFIFSFFLCCRKYLINGMNNH